LNIDLSSAAIVAVVTSFVVVLLMRTIGARQIAETRVASAAELAAAQRDLKWVRADAERKAQALDSAQSLLDKSEARLRDTFQALAADALKDNRASFLDLAKSSFEGYQQPIAESLSRVDQRLKEAERERLEAYSRLSEQVIALGSTANVLSRALRTPAVRGRWG
jgi:DNA recombination protein RmuC